MLALVRLLARVRPDVDGQGAPLDEALATLGMVALVRPLICVYPIMSLQIRLAVEALVMGQLPVGVIAERREDAPCHTVPNHTGRREPDWVRCQQSP